MGFLIFIKLYLWGGKGVEIGVIVYLGNGNFMCVMYLWSILWVVFNYVWKERFWDVKVKEN